MFLVVKQFHVCFVFLQDFKVHHQRLVPQFFLVQHEQFLDRQVVLPHLHLSISLDVVHRCRSFTEHFTQQIVMQDEIEDFIVDCFINVIFRIVNYVNFDFWNFFTIVWNRISFFIISINDLIFFYDKIVLLYKVLNLSIFVDQNCIICRILRCFNINDFYVIFFNPSIIVLPSCAIIVCGSWLTFFNK